MKLSEIKNQLNKIDKVNFLLPNGTFVPQHFHITEVGLIDKNFIDCGGTVRHEKVANFQLWEAGDFEHRLAPEKLLKIIALSEKVIGIEEDLEIEVEYQAETIGKYGLEFSGEDFVLVAKDTACLASDSCGIPAEKPAFADRVPQIALAVAQAMADKRQVNLSELTTKQACCAPGGGCC